MNGTEKRSIVFLLSHFPIPRFTKKINILINSYDVTLIYWNRSGKKKSSFYGPLIIDKKVKTFSFNKKVPLYNKKKKIIYFNLFFYKVLLLLFKIKPNIIHAANLDMLFLANIYSIFNKKVKIVYEIGDLPSIIFSDNKGLKKVLHKLFILIEKQLTKKISKIILTSPFFWSYYYSKFIEETKYVFLHNAPLSSIFEDFTRKTKYDFTIGFIGSIRYWDQLKFLIDTVNSIKPTIQLFFAGNGPELHKLLIYIKNKSNCKYFGTFNYEKDAAKLYSKIDCIYSVYDNNLENVRIALPNRLYDAILTKLPIICSQNTELGKFVSKHKIGFQIDISKPNEFLTIISLMMNNPKVIKHIEKKYDMLKLEIEPSKLCKKLLSIYEINENKKSGISRFITLIDTLKYMKSIQLYWRIVILFMRQSVNIKNIKEPKVKFIKFHLNISEIKNNNNCFKIFWEYININNLHWFYLTTSKLWNYHLNYFDYIHDFKSEKGIELINKWINDNKDSNHISWDPYPISLRMVNWIKFLTKHNINNNKIYNSLYQQAFVLFRRREYHLLTNHLFKNIVAMLFVGVLFNEKKWEKWALKELKKQLKEQLTIDDYHFELSPTYHAIFTKDLLDIYNLLNNNEDEDSQEFVKELEITIPNTLYWCEYFSENEKYLKINDVNYEGCPTLKKLNEYAKLLGIDRNESKHKNNHYPILENSNLRLMMYCAEHQPSYNPAHSHDDLTSILLWYKNEPILADTGNYCYDETEERDYSRSTHAHNCFTINGENQSEMWKVFRIGRRSKILQKNISVNEINCSHNGYKRFGVNYSRTIKKIDSGFEIIDNFISINNKSYKIYFHFHPETNLIIKENTLVINNALRIKFLSSNWKIIETEFYPEMFQKTEKKTVVINGKINEKYHSTIIEVIK